MSRFTRRQTVELAKALRTAGLSEANRAAVAKSLADALGQFDDRFDRETFMAYAMSPNVIVHREGEES